MGYQVYFNYEDDLGNVETLFETFSDYDSAIRFIELAENIVCYSDIELVDLEIDD